MKYDLDHIKDIIVNNSFYDNRVTKVTIEELSNHRVLIASAKYVTYYFYLNSKLIRFNFNKQNHNRGILKSFENWQNLNIKEAVQTCDYIVSSESFVKYYYIAACKVIDYLTEETSDDLKEGINLISLDNWPLTGETIQSNWYNKLLQEYTQYYQSGSKSDIADKHYQEQARLHGLKFVIR